MSFGDLAGKCHGCEVTTAAPAPALQWHVMVPSRHEHIRDEDMGGEGQKRKENEDLNLHWSKKGDAVYMQEGSAR